MLALTLALLVGATARWGVEFTTADNYHNLLVQQRNTIVAEQRRLGTMMNSLSQQGGDFQKQLRQFGAEVKDLEGSYRQADEELRDSVAEINKHYEELGKDEEIAKAFSELSAATKTKQNVGPSRELKDVMRALERSKQGRKSN